MSDPLLDLATSLAQGQRQDRAAELQGALNRGLDFDPDAYAKAMRTAAKTGVTPAAVLRDPRPYEAVAKVPMSAADLANMSPRTAAWLVGSQDNAAVAHDDLDVLAEIEANRNVASLYKLTPTQRQAVIADRIRMFKENAPKNEVISGMANSNSAFYSPFLDLAKSLGQWAGAAAGSVSEVGNFLTSGQTLNDTAYRIADEWKRPGRAGTLEGAISQGTEKGKAYIHSSVKQGPSQMLIDPATGKAFENPDYAWWGRPLVNTAEALPGTVAAFGVMKKAGPPVMAVNAGTEKYNQAVAAGASPFTAGTEALGSAGLNLALMTRLPAPVMTRTLAGGAAQALGRGTALGLGVTAGENALSWLHGSDKPLFEGATQNIVNMTGFELMPVVKRLVDVAQDSRLRARSPEKFREAMDTILQDSPVENVLIPAEAVQTYFQSQGIDPARAMDAAGAKNYLEALAAGTDVVIPTSGYLTALAKDHHAGLAPDLRLQADGLTPREMEAYQKEAVKVEAQVKAEGEAAVKDAADPAFQAIKEDTLQQLVAAGDAPDVAETRAAIHAQALVTMARREGLDPMVLQRGYGLRITRPAPGEAGTVADRALARAAQDGGDTTLYQDDRKARAREAMSRALSPSGQGAELNRRAAEAKAQEDAFQAWDAEVRPLVAGELHGEDNRGFIQFSNDNKVQIGLLEKADLSTFTHETGHLYMRILEDLAARPEATGQIKEDLAALRKFVGAEGDAPLTVAQQEKLARANEAYLMEGKAPSETLRAAFQRVKFWMMTVYRNLTGLGVKLNDEVRGVFDRIYASDAEIEAAREQVGGAKPLFASPEEMKATQAEFDLYVKKASKSIEQAKEDLAGRLIEELTRERESWWKEESAKVREQVTAEVDADAVYHAFKVLAEGQLEDGTPIKLSKEALEAQFGKGVGKELPRGFQRLYTREGGIDADAAAELLGLRSGEALVEALKVMEPRREHIERLTQERMKETHGDLMAPEAIAAAAQEEMHNDLRGEVLHTELRHLRRAERDTRGNREAQAAQDQARAEKFWARGVLNEVPPMETFKAAAVELVEGLQTKDLDPYRYLVAQRKASRESREALVKGDTAAAADAVQKELLNHFLYREAIKAQEEVTKAYDFAKKFGKASVRERIAKAGGDLGQQVYLDQIDNILERYEFAKVSNQSLEERQSLAAFAVAVANSGEMVSLDPMLYTGRPKNYRELTLPELRAVKDALANLETVARRQLEFIKDGKRVAFQDAKGEMLDAAYGNTKAKPLPLDPNARSRMDRIVSGAKRWNSELVKMEELIDRLDGGDINGPWRRYVFEPMAEAQYREHELTQAITAKLAEAMETMPKAQRLSMGDTFEVPGLGTVTRKFVLSMALNMGNESNQAKMFKGMGWASPDKVEAVGRALDRLNRADWEFVQKTWDALDSLWPEIEKLELRMRGIAPERVAKKAFTVDLADGTKMDLQGGYYPVVYDPARSSAGARQADVEIMTQEGGWNGPVTAKGHTKDRIDSFAAPLLMDFEQVLAKHTSRVVKDLSHREPALAVAKLIRDQEVRASVQETLGPEYEAQMLPWLKGTVNDVAAMNPELGKWMLQLRSNMVIAGLAFRASSVIVQVTDMGRVMVGEHAVAPRYLGSALGKMATHPLDTIQQIRELSPEMASRAENLDRDTRAMLKRLQGKEGAGAQAQKIGMAGLALADLITSHTSWLGAYEQALAEGMSRKEAVAMGDRVVRLKLQGGAPKDLTALQRDGNWGTKMLTTYMGDAVATYGMMSRAAFEMGQGRNVGRSAFAVLMAGMIIPMVGDLIKNRGPQSDDDKAWWAAKQALWNLPSSIPFVRDVAGAISGGRDYQFTPLASAINRTIVKPIQTAGSDREMTWEDWFLTGLDALGTLGGLPGTSQLMTTGRYLRDVHQGKQQPDNAAEATRDAILGPNPQKKGGR